MIQTATKPRIDYIDAIKGFSIFWVVIFHLGGILSLPLLPVPYRMPLFFFMSGIFFRQRPLKQFLIKRINTLIVPFIFFYLLTILVCVVRYDVIGALFPGIEHEGSTIGIIKKLSSLFSLHFEEVDNPLMANGALWFLIALFNIQVLYYAINKISRNIIFLLSVSIAFFVIGLVLKSYDINGLFYLNRSMLGFIYYAAGNIAGPKLMEFIAKRKNERILLSVCIPILVVFSLAGYRGVNIIMENLLMNIRIVCFIPIVFIFFKRFHEFVLLKPLLFFGRNSIILLGTHLIIFITFGTVFAKILHTPIEEFPLYGPMLLTVTIAANYFIILFLNKYLPWFVGAKELFTYANPNNAATGSDVSAVQRTSFIRREFEGVR